MAEMVSEHDEMAGLFAHEAKDGRVQSLKQLASSMLPAVQQHQALASADGGRGRGGRHGDDVAGAEGIVGGGSQADVVVREEWRGPR